MAAKAALEPETPSALSERLSGWPLGAISKYSSFSCVCVYRSQCCERRRLRFLLKMSQPNLQYAHTGAFEAYYQSPVAPATGRDQMAQQYFADRFQKEASVPVIIHDREHPQRPPHTYIAGNPTPLHYGVPLSDGFDPGVYAVSNALFDTSGAFRAIPLKPGPVFRRRQRGDCQSEWSNAFVSRVDPCECGYPEETYTPYEVARYRDQYGNPHTTLDFRR